MIGSDYELFLNHTRMWNVLRKTYMYMQLNHCDYFELREYKKEIDKLYLTLYDQISYTKKVLTDQQKEEIQAKRMRQSESPQGKPDAFALT